MRPLTPLRRPSYRAAGGLRLLAVWILLLLVGYCAGRGLTDARLGWDVGLSADMPEVRSASLTDAMRAITDVGAPAVIDGVLILASAVLLLRRRRRAVAYLAVCAGGTVLLAQLLKLWVDRARPGVVSHLVHAAGASWPSGHASSAAAIYGALAVLAASRLARPLARRLLIAAAVLVVFLIGVSRVYLGVHYATDVIAGWIIGAAWLGAVSTRLGRGVAARAIGR